jgi:hypothetical protein
MEQQLVVPCALVRAFGHPTMAAHTTVGGLAVNSVHLYAANLQSEVASVPYILRTVWYGFFASSFF